MTDIVTFAKALADPTRWRIVRLVMTETLCVCELADILAMPQSSVSSHVQIIRKAGLLESEKREKWTYFCIGSKHTKLIQTLENFFDGSSGQPWQSDLESMRKRLEQREDSCCPGPLLLKSKKSKDRPQSPCK